MKSVTGLSRLALGAALAMTLTAPAWAADTFALTSTRATGNQDWTGALGMDFSVNTPITVTQLGTYDSGANGIAGTIKVGIFRSDGVQVGPTATFSGSAGALFNFYDRYLDVADFVLPTGNYSIVAVGYSASDPNGNTHGGPATSTIDTGGGLITFTGGSRYTFNTALVRPEIGDGGPSNRYDAGTFMFTSAVPEPSTAAMMLAALGVVVTVAKRRSHAR